MRVDSRGRQALVSALGLRDHPSTWPGFMRTQPGVTPLSVFCRCLFLPFPLACPSQSLGYVHHEYTIRTPYVQDTYTIGTPSVLHDSWLTHRYLKPTFPYLCTTIIEIARRTRRNHTRAGLSTSGLRSSDFGSPAPPVCVLCALCGQPRLLSSGWTAHSRCT
jgi:hypothetical protein